MRKADAKRHSERAVTLIAHEAANFIEHDAQIDPLITVVGAKEFSHGERVTVFVTVFPSERVPQALAFLSRKREAFSDYLKTHTRLSPLPRIEFLLDDGSSALQVSAAV